MNTPRSFFCLDTERVAYFGIVHGKVVHLFEPNALVELNGSLHISDTNVHMKESLQHDRSSLSRKLLAFSY